MPQLPEQDGAGSSGSFMSTKLAAPTLQMIAENVLAQLLLFAGPHSASASNFQWRLDAVGLHLP